jgi:hypothetical protein
VKRIVFTTLMAMLLATSAWAFSTKDVIEMHKAGLADSLIMMKIAYSGMRFHLGASDIRKLKEAGVSDEVISEMLRTEGAGENSGGNGQSAHVYAAPYPYGWVGPYGYAPYWGPGFGLSFGFGYYGYHPYGYYAPYGYHVHYAPYGYYHPGFGYHGPYHYYAPYGHYHR